MARTKDKVGSVKPITVGCSGPGSGGSPSSEAFVRSVQSCVPSKKRKADEEGLEQPTRDRPGLGKRIQKAQLDAGRGTNTDTFTGPDGTERVDVSQPRVEAKDQGRESERTKNAQKSKTKVNRKSPLASQTAMTVEQAATAVEQAIKMQAERLSDIVKESMDKVTRIAVKREQTQCNVKLEAMKRRLTSVKRARDASVKALAQETSKAKTATNAKLELEKAFFALNYRKCNVDRHLLGMWEKVKNLTAAEQTSKKTLERAHAEFEAVRAGLQENLAQAAKEKVALENDLVSVRENKKRLQVFLEESLQDVEDEKAKVVSLSDEKKQLLSTLDKTVKRLEEEEERKLCQVCLVLVKDTICFPCLHLHYCFLCLDKHRKRTNSCPSCRTSIAGVLRCDISM